MQPNDVLSEGVRASAGARNRRLSLALVVGEIALSCVLLSLSTAMVGKLHRLMHVSPTFDPTHLLTFQLTVAPDTIPGKTGRLAYQDRLIRALQAIPGVTGVDITNQLSLDGCCLAPTVDGVMLPESPFVERAPATSAKIPVLVGSTRTEFGVGWGWPEFEDFTPGELTESMNKAYDKEMGARVLDDFRRGYPGPTTCDVFAIW
jgi:hypothetical protein